MADDTSTTGTKGTALEDPAHPTAPSRVAGATPHNADGVGKDGVRQPKGGVTETGEATEGTVKPGGVDPSGGSGSGGVA